MPQTPPQTPARPGLPPALDPRPDADPPRHSGRRRVGRVLRWGAILTSVFLLLASTALYLGFRHFDGKLTRTNIRLPQDASGPSAGADGTAQNFLIVGSDTREAPGTQKFGASKDSARYVGGQRSDTVMLMHVPAGRAKATIISFPRDSWVAIPAFTDAKGVAHPAHHQRINSAFSVGGAPLLVQVLQNMSGMRVDHYVQVDFAGFQQIVDALGGVTLCVKTTRNDQDSGDFLTAGTHKVNGKLALAFARDRKSFPTQDLARIKDQQYFLSVLLHKVLSAGTLANPLKINALLNAVTSATTVDRDLSINDMRKLALRMRHLDPAHVALVTVPVQGDERIAGQSVLVLDRAKMTALFADLKDNTSSGGSSAVTVPVAPSAISVDVLNSSGRAGLGARATADLSNEGFRARLGGNAGSGATSTVVRYGAGAGDQARSVAAALPGSTVTQAASASAGSVMVVLGSSYSGTRAVHARGAPSSSGTAADRTTAAASANGCGQ